MSTSPEMLDGNYPHYLELRVGKEHMFDVIGFLRGILRRSSFEECSVKSLRIERPSKSEPPPMRLVKRNNNQQIEIVAFREGKETFILHIEDDKGITHVVPYTVEVSSKVKVPTSS